MHDLSPPRPSSSHLLGRDGDAARLRSALEDGYPLVGLTGPPGIGKSALVRRVLRELPETRIVDLASVVSPEEAAEQVLLQLGQARGRGPALEVLARTALPALLVLDGADGFEPEPVLRVIGRVQVLVVRRRPVALEPSLGLGELDAEAAGELFARGVALHRGAVTPEQILAVVTAVGGHPLALMLLARRACALGVPALLAGTGVPDRLQELLRAESAALPEPAAQVLAGLAALAAPVAGELVVPLLGPDAAEGVDELARRGLLAMGTQVGLLPVLRQALEPSPEHGAKLRAALLDLAWPRVGEPLEPDVDWARRHARVLVAELPRCVSEPELALRAALSLRPLVLVGALPHERYRALLDQALALGGRAELRARLSIEQERAHRYAGIGEDVAAPPATLHARGAEPEALFAALERVAAQGRLDEAREHLEALDRAEGGVLASRGRIRLASAVRGAGDVDEAEQLLRTALGATHAHPAIWAEAATRLAGLLSDGGDPEGARSWVERALARLPAGPGWVRSGVLGALGELDALTRGPRAGRHTLAAALDAVPPAARGTPVAAALRGTAGLLALELGDLDAALAELPDGGETWRGTWATLGCRLAAARACASGEPHAPTRVPGGAASDWLAARIYAAGEDALPALLQEPAACTTAAKLAARYRLADRPDGGAWPPLTRTLWCDDGGARLRIGGRALDLSRRRSARGVARALVLAAERDRGAWLDHDALFEAGWPGERIAPDSARNRLHVTLSQLRKTPLGAALDSGREGVRLALDVVVVRRGGPAP